MKFGKSDSAVTSAVMAQGLALVLVAASSDMVSAQERIGDSIVLDTIVVEAPEEEEPAAAPAAAPAPAPAASRAAPRSSPAPLVAELIDVPANQGTLEAPKDITRSVTVIDRTEIEDQLAISNDATALIAKYVPGFSMNNQSVSGASETFRGRDTKILVNGVSRNTPLRDTSRMLALIDLNNVERVEIIAGSSSTFGSGATGGTINFITKRPAAGKPQVTVNTNLSGFTADLGDSLNPEVSVGLSGVDKNTGIDYVATLTGELAGNTYAGNGDRLPSDPMLGQGGSDNFKRGNANLQLGKDFSDQERFEVSASLVYFNQDPEYLTTFVPYTSRNATVPVLGPSQLFTFYPLQGAEVDFDSPYPGRDVLEDSKYFTAHYEKKDFFLGALDIKAFHNNVQRRFAYQQAGFENNYVYAAGAPGAGGVDPTNMASVFSAFTSPYNQTEQDSKVTGIATTINSELTEKLGLAWGVDFQYEEGNQYFADGVEAIAPMDQHSLGAFAQFTADITEKLTVVGGSRYDRFDLTVDDFIRPAYNLVIPVTSIALGLYPETVLAIPGVVPANIGTTDFTGGSAVYDHFTFNLGGTYEVTEKVQLFGGFSQGFALPDVGAFTRRAGQTGALSWDPTASFDGVVPEAQIVNNYEIGLRGGWERTRGSVTGFYSTSEEGVNFNPQTNRLSQEPERIWGVEVAGSHDVTDAFTVGGTFGFREGQRKLDGEWYWLPNNRIGSSVKAVGYGQYTFDNGVMLRGEIEHYGGRDKYDGNYYDQIINYDTLQYVGGYRTIPLEQVTLFNFLATAPWGPGQITFGVQNLFDEDYFNDTATSTRNIPVQGLGRTVAVGYRATF